MLEDRNKDFWNEERRTICAILEKEETGFKEVDEFKYLMLKEGERANVLLRVRKRYKDIIRKR